MATLIVIAVQAAIFYTWGKHCGEDVAKGKLTRAKAIRFVCVPSIVLGVMVFLFTGENSLSDDGYEPAPASESSNREFSAAPRMQQDQQRLINGGRVLLSGIIPGLIAIMIAQDSQRE